jgi:hypothetical protein
MTEMIKFASLNCSDAPMACAVACRLNVVGIFCGARSHADERTLSAAAVVTPAPVLRRQCGHTAGGRLQPQLSRMLVIPVFRMVSGVQRRLRFGLAWMP